VIVSQYCMDCAMVTVGVGLSGWVQVDGKATVTDLFAVLVCGMIIDVSYCQMCRFASGQVGLSQMIRR